MKKLVLPTPKITHDKKQTTVEATVKVGSKKYNLWYKLPAGLNISEAQASDALLCLLLLPAMKTADLLVIEDPVSKKLLQSVEKIQNIFLGWWPNQGFNRVAVQAKSRVDDRKSISYGVATCFSGGVDSFYTLLKHREEITHLVFFHGFDLPLHETTLRKKVSKSLQKAARKFDKKLIEAETNIQELTNDIAEWGEYSHGSAIASTALMLGSQFDKLYMPSTMSYQDLFPWGSHALLDALWSTENVDIVHDGAEATRIAKVAEIAQNQDALNYIRVCWQTRQEYNCSKCDKCIMTMTSLAIVGALKNCPTFCRTLTVEDVAKTNIQSGTSLTHAHQSIDYASIHNINNKIVDALAKAIEDYYNHEMSDLLKKQLNKFVASQHYFEVRDQLIATLWRASSKQILYSLPSAIAYKLKHTFK